MAKTLPAWHKVDNLIEGGSEDEMMTEEMPVTEQVAAGFMEIAICLAQALHETDPGLTQRMNFAAGLAYNRLMSQGNETAAEIVYAFGRSLLNRELFPVEEKTFDSEQA